MPFLYKRNNQYAGKHANLSKQNAHLLYMPIMMAPFLFLIQYMVFFLLLCRVRFSIISTIIKSSPVRPGISMRKQVKYGKAETDHSDPGEGASGKRDTSLHPAHIRNVQRFGTRTVHPRDKSFHRSPHERHLNTYLYFCHQRKGSGLPRLVLRVHLAGPSGHSPAGSRIQIRARRLRSYRTSDVLRSGDHQIRRHELDRRNPASCGDGTGRGPHRP